MKNNKGFTIVELAVTFSLIAVIMILLFQLIVSLREIYVAGEIKTSILSKQGIMTKKIEDDLFNKDLTNVETCGVNCILFTYSDSKKYTLKIDTTKQIITYNNYSWKLTEGNKIGIIESNIQGYSIITETDLDNAIFTLKIPVKNKLVDGDYGINIIYQYNTSKVNIPNSLNIVNS